MKNKIAKILLTIFSCHQKAPSKKLHERHEIKITTQEEKLKKKEMIDKKL